jgi:hypothetical protein
VSVQASQAVLRHGRKDFLDLACLLVSPRAILCNSNSKKLRFYILLSVARGVLFINPEPAMLRVSTSSSRKELATSYCASLSVCDRTKHRRKVARLS